MVAYLKFLHQEEMINMVDLDELKMLDYEGSSHKGNLPKSNLIPMWAVQIIFERPFEDIDSMNYIVDTRDCFRADGIHVDTIVTDKHKDTTDTKHNNSQRKIIYIWHDDGKGIYYYDSDDSLIMSAGILNPALFSRVQSCLIRKLYGDKLNIILYDSIDTQLRNSIWISLPTIYAVMHDNLDDVTILPAYDKNDDEPAELDWYVVEGIMSLGTYDRYFPLSKSDLLFADLSFDIKKYTIGEFKTCVIILDGDNPIVAFYHNNMNMRTDMMCFNEERFWVLYEQLTANFQ
jgi:hypothetical protein